MNPLSFITSPLQMLGGAGIMFAAMFLYDGLIDDPSVRKEARLEAFAEAERKTQDALDKIEDRTTQARAKLALCNASGGVFNFSTLECK